MNLITLLIIFDMLVIIYQVLIEVFTILYRINGINVDISRFQVVSLLTGTGFTTNESESMLITKNRRKLTRRIMFFSYIFNISIVSTFVSIFSLTANTSKEDIPICIRLTLFIIIFLILFYKTNIRKSVIDKIVIDLVNKRKTKKENFVFIYDTFGNKVIAEIELTKLKRSMKNKTIEEMQLSQKYHISLLVIKRKEQIISEIKPTTVLEEGDTVIVFGKTRDIKNAFIKEIEKVVQVV